MASKDKRDAYQAKLYRYQEENSRKLCIYNISSVVITLSCLAGTLIILNTTEQEACSNSWLRITLWLMVGMHGINALEGVCGLTGLDKIFCGCLCVVAFFAYEVAVLAYI